MKNEDFEYREGDLADLNQLQQLCLLSYGQFRDVVGEGHWKTMEAGLMKEETYRDLLRIGKCFICQRGEEITGMAFLVPHGNPTKIFDKEWAYLRLVGVHPKYEGIGIGKKLTQMCIDAARESGEKIIALHTSEFHDAARHIYEKAGFKIEKELGNIYGKRYFLYTLMLNDKMDTITYHKATTGDTGILAEHRILFATELKGEQPEEMTNALRAQMTAYFNKATAENTCISIIAKAGDNIAGIGSVHIREQPGNFMNPNGKWGYVMNMYTVPAYRRRGICTGILDALISEAQKEGITAFELHATKEGEFVYKQNGFTLHNEPTYRKFIQ